ncbi:hypothetical protein Acsp05_31350 [Actinokineospora sp. NBRC 105648]|nr:hypothetical protein Acsp05_31350 [Actinokineospora sp. NBRC 105648]
MKAAAAAAACAALVIASAPTASAATAVLSNSCYGGWFAFDIVAVGGPIPAGSQWTSSYSGSMMWGDQYDVRPVPGIVQVTKTSHKATVTLTNPAAIPAGSGVTLTLSGYPLSGPSGLSLQLNGYGGYTSAHFDVENGDWPQC